MTRKQLLLLLGLVFVTMVFAGHGVWTRYQILREDMAMAAEESISLPEPTTAVVSGDPSGAGNGAVVSTQGTVEQAVEPEGPAVPAPVAVTPPAVPANKPPVNVRKTFYYDGAKAQTVQLVGDFNKWSPEDFLRDAKGRWTISIPLPPGDYSYSFIVDGKTVRDPYQRRTDAKGRSLLTVK